MPTKTECNMTMESKQVPNHTHTCTGSHTEGTDHYCGECKRFWKPRSIYK